MIGQPAVLGAAAAVLVVLLGGVWQLIASRLDRAQLARRSELARVEFEASLLRSRLDARLRRTALGEHLATETSRAGLAHSALDLLATYLGAAAFGFVLISAIASTLLGIGGAAIGVWGVRLWLERRRQARLEDFVAQLPELARVLSNATAAGRSLPSALRLAADDLDEPASTELRLVTEQLRIGQPTDEALDSLEERLPSRELAVLVSTLGIQQRSGGDVVTALRDMAETLDSRKDLRREVKTIVASAVQTGYVTGALGVGLILMVNALQPGMIDLMTRRPLGQLALAISVALYAVAFTAVRRMTDIDV